MAIQTETARILYAGNNSTVIPYPVTFQFLADADLVVVVTAAGMETVLVLNADYTVAGLGYPDAGGSITTTAAVPATSTVTIYRDVDFTQTTAYIEADEFPAASHERALDKGIMLDQQLEEARQRAFRLTLASPMLPALTAVNNALLGLDPTGAPFFKTANEVLTWLQLAQTLGNFPTKTFANAAEKAVAVPDFLGQVGTQRDTKEGYIGTALSAGSWIKGVSGVAAGAIDTPELHDGALSANAAGRLKMAAAYLMATHLNADAVAGQTSKSLLNSADRILGWSSADAALRTFAGNVVTPPGSVVQTHITTYTANTNLTAVLPTDDTIPQITEGTEIITLPFVPLFSTSAILLSFTGSFTANAAIGCACAIFRDPITNALGAQEIAVPLPNYRTAFAFCAVDVAGSVLSRTYTVKAGPGTAGIIRFNGSTVGRLLGGAQAATLIAQEIKQ